MPAQKIIDLDAAVPESIGVKIDGVVYELPGDIPVPDFLAIARLLEDLGDASEDADPARALSQLYEAILDLFRKENTLPTNAEGEEELPIGPQRLGNLVVELYADAAEDDAGKAPRKAAPARRNGKAGTPSTPRRRTPRKSASSK